jgi:MerR family transcriptional regulator, light-induced transcriptional regulator
MITKTSFDPLNLEYMTSEDFVVFSKKHLFKLVFLHRLYFIQNQKSEIMSHQELSIGDIAELTGLSVLRIRSWEKRYGYPQAERLDSGHRRYNRDMAVRLMLLNLVSERGMRISKALPLSDQDLRKYVGQTIRPMQVDPHDDLGMFKLAIQRCDAPRLNLLLKDAYDVWGNNHLTLYDRVLIPLLNWVGTAWEKGEIGVGQEHLASTQLERFLGKIFPEVIGGPIVLFCMFDNDHHTFGLQMSALTAAHAGVQGILMRDPLDPRLLAEAAIDMNAKAIVTSISATQSWDRAKHSITWLRELIGPDIPIWAGGAGVRENINTIQYCFKFDQFHQEMKSLVQKDTYHG